MMGLSSLPLPERACGELPTEVEDPAQFGFKQEHWNIIPPDIQVILLRRYTGSNDSNDPDPAGLNLRAMIRALGESVKRGGLPLYLLRRKKPRYGTLDNRSKQYCPTLNRQEGRDHSKILDESFVDDLEDYYFSQIFHSTGKSVEMTLTYTDNIFLDGSRVDASVIAKLKSMYVVTELRIDVCKWFLEFSDVPVADTFYLSVKQKNDSWKSYSSDTDKKSGLCYPRFRFTAGGVKYKVCGMFLTPVIYNIGGPAFIKSDAAILVHKDKSTSNMRVSIEKQSMNGMYGATRPSDAYGTWTLPSPPPSPPQKKQRKLPMENIRKNEISSQDVLIITGTGVNSHAGTASYRQEINRISGLPKQYGRCVKEALNLVDRVRKRGGRFLKERERLYYDVGDQVATAYTVQSIKSAKK